MADILTSQSYQDELYTPHMAQPAQTPAGGTQMQTQQAYSGMQTQTSFQQTSQHRNYTTQQQQQQQQGQQSTMAGWFDTDC